MRTILIDDDQVSLGLLAELCQTSEKIELVGIFTDPLEALSYAKEHYVELVLSDIEMPGLNGIALAMKLRELQPKVVVMFTTSYKEHYLQAMEIDADFYMLKPYSIERINAMVERAYLLSKRMDKRLKITMIGPFSLVLDGRVIKAKNAKARELMALCLDHRGGLVSREEAVDKLWPGKPFDANAKKLLNKAENYIKKYLEQADFTDFFFTTHAGCYVNTELVDCDYYEYIRIHGHSKLPEGYLEEFEWSREMG